MSATGTASSSTFLRGDNSWAAAGGGGFELLASTNASNASSIDFEATATGFTVADYTQFLIILTGIYPNTSTQLIQLQTDASDGASYQTDGYTYAIHSIDFDSLYILESQNQKGFNLGIVSNLRLNKFFDLEKLSQFAILINR
jgi:hypothetical protein